MNTTQMNSTRRPQFCYVREPQNAPVGKEKRFIAIAMSYDDTGKVRYGASIFRRQKDGETYTKKSLRTTAQGRFEKKPVEFNLPSNGQIKYSDVVSEVRRTMYRKGVYTKKNTTTSS